MSAACEQGDFLCCTEKVNLGLDNNTWGGGFSKYCLVPGEILKIHRHALWEIPQGVDYEEAAVLDPICNAYKSIAQQSKFLPGQDVVVFGTGPLGLFSVQMARIMGAVNIVMVGLEEDVAVRFPIAKELGATAVVNGSTEDVVTRCQEICGKDNLGLVIECSGVEQGEAGGEHAGVGLDAAYQHPFRSQRTQMVDEFRRRQVAMLDEDPVGRHQAGIVERRSPAELALERRTGFVMALDAGHRGHPPEQLADAFQQPVRRGETGLHVDDQQGLAHR